MDKKMQYETKPVKHGYWKYSEYSKIAHRTWYECTCCGKFIADRVGYNYCPKCGTKMDVVPVVHGHWVPRNEMIRSPFAKNYDCSVCGVSNVQYNFCPNCGAEMDEEMQDENT